MPLFFRLILYVSWMTAIQAHAITLSPGPTDIPVAYFGLHIHRAASTTPWPSVRFGSWRLWDAYAAWPNLEPRKGHWGFGNVDAYVKLSIVHDVELVMPLGLSPRWASARPGEKCGYQPGCAAEPRDMADWRHYVEMVAYRYKGRIRNYELWNEVNVKGFFSGSVEQMVALACEAHRLLKHADPANVLVSPSVVNSPEWLDAFFAKGGGQCVDVIGYHFYVPKDPPETMLPLISRVRAIMAKHLLDDKPLWNTEYGWMIESREHSIDAKDNSWKVLSMDDAAAYLSRSLILGWAAGLQRNFWYAWDNGSMGLWEEKKRQIKPAAAGYSTTARWLIGARMRSCRTGRGGLWICALERDTGRRAWLVWNIKEERPWTPPETWGISEYETLDGSQVLPETTQGRPAVVIGPKPVLLKADGLPWGGGAARTTALLQFSQ